MKLFLKQVIKDRILILMALPSAIFIILFSYVPLPGIVIAFQRFRYNKGFFGSPFVGFDNFRFFFISGQAWLVTLHTVLYNVVFIGLGTILTVMVAIFLSELTQKHFKKITQSLMFLPYFISWVTGAALFYGLFNYEYGILNNVLKSLGSAPMDIYNDPNIWPFIIVAANIWKGIGYGAVYYLAAIVGVDEEQFEAAKIDGANIFQKILYVTLPNLTPTIVILVLLSIGGIFRGDFGLFYQLTGSNPLLYDKTDIIDTFVFRSLMTTKQEGMAAAVGLYQSVLCFITIMAANFAVKKYNRDYSLF